MPRTNPTRPITTAAGLAILLAAAPVVSSIALAQDSSPAPVQNGASQVKITLTGDNGGACVLDHSTAAAGPVTFAVTNKTATGITEIELMSSNRIIGEKENLAPGLPTVSFTVTRRSARHFMNASTATAASPSFAAPSSRSASSHPDARPIDWSSFANASGSGHV